MIPVAFAIPGDLASLTGGYGYDRRVLALLPRFGIAARHVELPASFPAPSEADRSRSLALIEAARCPVALIDGLAYGAFRAEELASLSCARVALVHHPLGYESGLEAARRAELIASERSALCVADAVIVTSDWTAALLASEFGVEAARISTAVPGADAAPRAIGSGSATVELIAVGAIIPRKAYDVLVAALHPLAQLDWHLTIAGSSSSAPDCATALLRQISAAGLGERITVLGELDTPRLEKFYAAADIFVMPSLFEGYGMALAEALVRGLPIIATTGGAAARTVPDAAALKLPPGDVVALSEALTRLIGDKSLRGELAEASFQSGKQLPRWNATADRVATVLRRVASGESACARLGVRQ